MSPTNEVETLAARATHVRCDKVDLALLSAQCGVESTGPDLSVGGELVLRST